MPARNTPLSALQRGILALAWTHRQQGQKAAGRHPDVYLGDVLVHWWGFPAQGCPPVLPKAQLGARYRSARVATSKALRRLQARGLLRRGRYHELTSGAWYRGAVLTDAGVAMAQRLADVG